MVTTVIIITLMIGLKECYIKPLKYTYVKWLCVDELGIFNRMNPTALAYTRCLNYLANTYSEKAILATLLVCIKGDALEWLTGLEEETTMMMSDNLYE
jgi:uncharacterized membrane protein